MSGGQITIKKDFGNHKINNDKYHNTQVAYNILEEVRSLNTQLSLNYITSYIYQLIREHIFEIEDNPEEFERNFKSMKDLLASVLSSINEKYEEITLEVDTILSIKSIIQKLTTAIDNSNNEFTKTAEFCAGWQGNFPQHLEYQMSNINFVIKNIEQFFVINTLEHDKTAKTDIVKNFFVINNIHNRKFSIKNLIDFDNKIIDGNNHALTKTAIASLLRKLKNDLLNNQILQQIHLKLNKLHADIKKTLNGNHHLLSPKGTQSLHNFFYNMHKSSLVIILEREDFCNILGENTALLNHFKEQIDDICNYCFQLKTDPDFQRKIDSIPILNIIHAYMLQNNIDNTDSLQLDEVKDFYLYQQKNTNSKTYKIRELISLANQDINFLAVAIFLHGLNNTLDDNHHNMSLFKLINPNSIYNILKAYDKERIEQFRAMIRLIPSIVNFGFYSNFKPAEDHCSITQDDLLCLLRLTQVPTHKDRCDFLKENHFKFYEMNKTLFKREPASNANISLSKLPALYTDVLNQYTNINDQIILNNDPYEIINNILMLWQSFDNAYIIEQEIYTSILEPLFKKNLSRHDFKNEIEKMLSQNEDIFPSTTSTSISADFKRQIYKYALKIYLRSFDFAYAQNQQNGKASYAPFFGVFEVNIPIENIIKKLTEYHKEFMKETNSNQEIPDSYKSALNILEFQYSNEIQIHKQKEAVYNNCLDAYKILDDQYRKTIISSTINKNIYNNYKLALNNLFEQVYTKNYVTGEMSNNLTTYDQCFKAFMQSTIQYNNTESLKQASVKLHLLRIWENQLIKSNPKNAATAPICFYRRRAIKPDTISTQALPNKQTLSAFTLDRNNSMINDSTKTNTTIISDETNVVDNVKYNPIKLHNT